MQLALKMFSPLDGTPRRNGREGGEKRECGRTELNWFPTPKRDGWVLLRTSWRADGLSGWWWWWLSTRRWNRAVAGLAGGAVDDEGKGKELDQLASAFSIHFTRRDDGRKQLRELLWCEP